MIQNKMWTSVHTNELPGTDIVYHCIDKNAANNIISILRKMKKKELI